MTLVAGLSRLLDASTDGTSIPVGNMLGTVAYTAPEVFKDSFVTKPSDVYAFGILSTPSHHWFTQGTHGTGHASALTPAWTSIIMPRLLGPCSPCMPGLPQYSHAAPPTTGSIPCLGLHGCHFMACCLHQISHVSG